MRGMTRRAAGCDNQTLAQQPFAMDALGKVLNNVVLMDDALLRHLRSLLMALATKERNLQRSDLRLRILRGENIVRSVTVLARRCERVTALDGFAVQRLRVKLFLGRVTRSAINTCKLFFVRQFFRR